MTYKMKRGTAPKFKELGSSPAKQVKVNYPTDFNYTGDNWPDKTPEYKDTKAAKIKEALKTHHKHTVGPEAMESSKNAKVSKVKQLKKIVKKYVPKVLKQFGKRLGPVGAAITATEIAMTIPKATKALQEGLKKEAKKRSKGKATDLFTGPKY